MQLRTDNDAHEAVVKNRTEETDKRVEEEREEE